MNTKQPVVVIFRKWKRSDSVFALFPEEKEGSYCMSYEKVWQHSTASYNHCINSSVPAKPEEYESLAKELANIGYVLKIQQRYS